MDIGGYSGEILHVDLTERKFKKEKINMDAAANLLGGLGYNMKLMYDLMEPGVDPLSPENILILGAGVLVGTFAPGASRVFAATKLPINNRIGWCGGGGMRWRRGGQVKRRVETGYCGYGYRDAQAERYRGKQGDKEGQPGYRHYNSYRI